ncbi:hypothetical protein, partial [Serratia marcescens]|uniref:hypothetical protein n=1 Tax=Serratia marcescens TaxID=615 RepID=UPI0019558CE3
GSSIAQRYDNAQRCPQVRPQAESILHDPPFREKRLLALFSHLQHRNLHSCFLVSTAHRSSRCSLNGYTVSSGHFPL